MFRKILCITAAVLFLGSVTVFSEGETSEKNANLLKNYKKMSWTGKQLYYDAYSTAVYFKNNGTRETKTAVLTLDVEEGMTGFMFRTDAGNGAGEGFSTSPGSGSEDSGFCTVTFYDSGHNSLLGVSTGIISGLEYYTRFSVGEETKYYPVPEGAETVEIVLAADQKGNTDNVHMYFRNLALFFSNEMPLLPAGSDTLYMETATGLSLVEIGVLPYERYLWIGFIFLVAIAFFVISVWRQKYKTPTVMKGTDRKRR